MGLNPFSPVLLKGWTQDKVCSELRDAVVQLSRSLEPFFKFPSSFSLVSGERVLRMRSASSAAPAGEPVLRMRSVLFLHSAVEEPRDRACAVLEKSAAAEPLITFFFLPPALMRRVGFFFFRCFLLIRF